MYNLSDLIKTYCCIDCGTNDKLREMVGKMGIPESLDQVYSGIHEDDKDIIIKYGTYSTYNSRTPAYTIPLTSINIDL